MSLSNARIRKLKALAQQADAKALEQKAKMKDLGGKVKEKAADLQIGIEEKVNQIKNSL